MKNSGGNKKKKALSFKTLGLVLIAILSVAFFAFGGLKTVQSAFIGLQKWLDPNEELGQKTKSDNGDGTYKLSLTVVGDAIKKIEKVNVIVIVDRSNSMDTQSGTGSYVASSSNGSTMYGLIDGEYKQLERRSSGYGQGTTYTYWYNGTQYTGQRYIYDSTATRLEATKAAVNGLANSLLGYNGKDGNPDDTVEMALVTFASTATTNISKTTSASTFTSTVNGLSTPGGWNGGTNWEAALSQANGISFGDSDSTYVIFFSDGAPTFRNTQAGFNDRDNRAPSGVYGSGQEQEPNMERAYNQATDDAATVATKVGVNNFYTIFAYGEDYGATYMTNLTTAAGAPAANNYSASNTVQLEEAFASILSQIEMAGIGSVQIEDGTTNQVQTSTGVNVELLDVDESSYQYWITDPSVNGGERTEWKSTDSPAPPEAHLENGTVKWDLSSLGVLKNDVTYEVTFDVYPSQTTYDLIADLKNGTKDYNNDNDVDPVIRQYLKKDGDNYTLETNTVASISYVDTRLEPTDPNYNKVQTYTYDNPPAVNTTASEIEVKKVWENDIDGRREEPVTMDLLRDGTKVEDIELNEGGNWKDGKYIATGLLKASGTGNNKTIQVLDSGHDYKLTEPVGLSYRWELDSEIVHPMLINGELTTLVKVESELDIPEGISGKDYYIDSQNREFYRINNAVYYAKYHTSKANLTATNSRKSNLNITKTVEGDGFEGDEFVFTFKLTNVGDTEVWFSIYDENNQPVSDVTTTATPEGGDSTYYYVTNGTEFTVNMQAGWNLRFINLGTGSTYEVSETLTDPYELTSVSATTIVSSTKELPLGAVPVAGQEGKYTYAVGTGENQVSITFTEELDENGDTYYSFEYTPKVNGNKSVGEVVAPNTTYTVEYINTFPETHVNVEKEWHGGDKEVEVTLYKSVNGGAGSAVTTSDLANTSATLTNPKKLNTSNEWTNLFEHLKVFDTNKNVVDYYVLESELDGNYVTTYEGTEDIALTATNVPANVNSVAVTVNIVGANGTETKEVTLTRDDNFKATLSGIEYINEDGTPKTVSVTTESTATINYLFNNRNIKITNEELTTVEGTKTWEDAENQDGVRPESITVKLIADGDTENPVGTKVVRSSDNWTWTWENLPKYKAVTENGETTYVEIVYTVEEAEVQYYDGEITENTDYSITNTHTPFKSTITINKSWEDANNQDGIRPDYIDVVLQDSTGLILTDGNNNNVIRLTAANNWTATVEVQRRSSGADVTYTVKEVGVVTEDYTAVIANPSYETETTTNQDRVITLGIENTHTPEEIELSGEKTWSDANNQDCVRPASIQVTLYADGQPVQGKTITVTPDADGNWTYNFGKLPKYKSGSVGEEIKYTVRENDLTSLGYTATYYDGTNLNILNTRTPETTGFEGTKTWEDANDQDGLRPTSITVQLYADGTAVEGKTVTISADADGNWPTYSFDNLQKYKNNGTENEPVKHEIVYTVRDTVDGYTSSTDSATSLVNTHTPKLINVSGAKTWDDDDNRDNKRPTSITIQLLADGEPVSGKVANVTAAADGSWSWTFENVPQYRDHGVEIVYTVQETGVNTDDYEITVNGTDVTNTHTPETVDVEGTKTWSDADDQDGIRPQSITIKLLADGEETGETTTASAPNWTYSFTGLPKYLHGEVGHEIEYSVEEVEVPNYTPNPTGYNIENTHTPFSTTITVKKDWTDANNQDGKRPTSIDVVLQDSTGLILTDANNNNVITLTEENDWTATVTVQRRSAGSDVTYTVKEVGVVTEDYTAVLADPELGTTTGTNSNQTITLNIDNQHTPETVDVEGSKTWDDADDQDGKRPQSIIINLLADGQVKESKTVTADDGWSWSWTDLPKYLEGQVGHEIVYTITENAVPNYNDPEVNGYDVTNTHTPETTSVSGTKTWTDANNQDGKRPTSITINLLADGTVIDSKTVTANDNWSWSWTDLPKYEVGKVGHEITYTITENAVTGYTPNVSGYDVTNTHIPETTEVSGVKNWVDNDDQDGKRPTSITVNLLADGEKVDSKTVTEADGWAYSFTNLPKYEVGKVGHEITYTITENAVTDYSTAINGNDITNTHIPGKVVVSGSKTWTDANDQDGARPTSITINLLANGTQVDSKVVTANDNWTWTFDNLDEYANGQKITYTITENEVDDYTTTVSGYNVENKHTPETVDVEGTKTWDDTNDQDGLRPTSITVNLLADGVEVAEKVVSASTNWSYSFTDLPKYEVGKVGHEITYTVVEDEVTGYTATTTEGTEYGITNTHTPATVDVEGVKTWTDADNQDDVRPASIEITLKADGTVVETKTVTEADGWAWSWTGLDKYKNHGTEIIYTVEEGEVEYYEATPTNETGFDITNTHTPFKTSVKVVKTWDDASNQDGKRPTSVTFSLMQDGVKIYESIELNEANNWTYENNDLPRRAAGKDITYSVVEIDVNRDDYTPSDTTDNAVATTVNSDQTTTITVKNTHTPETVDVEGTKTWTDENNQDGKRPESITVNLLADNAVIDTKTVTANDGWSWSWTNLPKYEVGKVGHEITYSVSEEAVTGYRAEITGYDIENIHEIDTTSINGTKIWSDNNDQDGIRPASVVVTLYADGEAIETQTANVSNNWSYSFTDLPVNKAGAVKQAIVYTVGEAEDDIPEGYTPSVSGNNITNTHTPATIDITGTKVWADANNQDGVRPASITVNLLADGTQVDSTTVTGGSTAESWNYSFTGKPKYRDKGTEIVYTVTESGVSTDDYSTTISGTTITNTHTPSEVEVPVSKTWVDTENKEGKRPTSVSVSLLADGTEVRTATLTEENGWSWNWTGLPENRNEGTKIEYTVRENNVDENYEVSYPTATTIVNTIKNLSKDIPVAKIWDDQNNRDNARPTTITYTLTGTVPGKDRPVVEKTLEITINDVDENDPNKWKSAFENVPIFDEGTWITYTVNELDVTGYTAVSNETIDGVVTITNKHELTTIDLTATKTWEDNEDNDGKRPESVQITLYADGVEQETKTATAESNWQVKFEGLVKYAEGEVGREIVYTVAEKEENVPAGYTSSVTGNTITNTHEAMTISYKVTKDWQDFDNNDGKRPEYITVRLVGKVGDTVVTEKTMNVYEFNEGFENEPWTYAFTDLPKYYNKQLVQYTLTEDNVDLYETQEIKVIENTEETTTIENEITNTHDKIPYNETGTITVNKYWYDENDKYKKRPGSITVNLLADDEIVASAELSEANDWSFTFENLPKYTIRDGEVGCEIVYTIQEVAVTDYQTEIDGFDIYNTYNGPIPEITPPVTGVGMTKENGNILFEMILTLLATSYTVVVLRKVNE